MRLCRDLNDKDDEANAREDTGSKLSGLETVKANIILAMVQYLESKLDWLRQFQPAKAASMLALMLDHRYKQLKIVNAHFSGNSPKAVVNQYSDLLLNMVKDVYEREHKVSSAPVHASTVASQPKAPEENFADIYAPSEGHETTSSRVKQELDAFRGYVVRQEELEVGPLQWWPKHKGLFPDLYVVAQAIFTIPGSQNDVERLFSIAGYLSSHRRNGMSVEMLEELVYINRNWPTIAEEKEMKAKERMTVDDDNLAEQDQDLLLLALASL